MGQPRWGKKNTRGGRKKNLCARQRHDEKSANNFSFTIFQPNRFRGKMRSVKFKYKPSEVLRFISSRGIRISQMYLYLYTCLRRYYELLWESVGLSCGIGSLRVCLQFSRATIFAVEFFTQRFPAPSLENRRA